MLLSTTSRSGEPNQLKDGQEQGKKRKRNTSNDVSSRRGDIQYDFLGRRIFLNAFSAIRSLSEKTIHRHANSISSDMNIEVYEMNRANSIAGKSSDQSIILCAFLIHFSPKFGLPDPRGSLITAKIMRQYLPSFTTCRSVTKNYCDDRKKVADAAFSAGITTKLPGKPLVEQKLKLP